MVWREAQWLPSDLVFKVSYLGGEMPTFALNFSRPGAQVLLQYYAFLRLGIDGYTAVQQASQDVAKFLSAGIEKIGAFALWNDGSDIPVFAWRLKAGHTKNWNLYHLQDRLRMKGWLVPAYPMPDDLADLTVQRIVVRNGLSMDLAEDLLEAIQTETAYLDASSRRCPSRASTPGSTTRGARWLSIGPRPRGRRTIRSRRTTPPPRSSASASWPCSPSSSSRASARCRRWRCSGSAASPCT